MWWSDPALTEMTGLGMRSSERWTECYPENMQVLVRRETKDSLCLPEREGTELRRATFVTGFKKHRR